MHRVVITDFITGNLEPEKKVLSGIANVEALNASNESELAGKIEDADAIMMYHNLSIGRKTLEKLTRCKLIVRCGVGIDNVDYAFAATRNIRVANIPDYGTEDVADSAIGMMLALARGFHRLNSALREGRGEWSYTQAVPLRRLRGRTLGIVGLGRIGTAVAVRAKALGMDVLFYDPLKPDGNDKALGIRRCESLEELLSQSFVITFHCPLTDQTRHMINPRTIELLPRGAILINVSRGQVVDTDAIAPALASGRLSGAAIDVLAVEPPTGNESILRAWRDPEHTAYDCLILNPHSAFYCEEGLMEIRVKGAESCRRALVGETVRNVVNGVGASL